MRRNTRARSPGPGTCPRIRSTCPVATMWVRKFHPGLTDALVPLVPPYIAHARLVKRLYPEGCAVVYVSPCYARKDEIFEPGLEGAVDAAIDFFELKRLIAESPPLQPRAMPLPCVQRPQPVEADLAHGRLSSADPGVVRPDRQRGGHRPRPARARGASVRHRTRRVRSRRHRHAELRGLHRRPDGEPGTLGVRQAKHRGSGARAPAGLLGEQPLPPRIPARGRPHAHASARTRSVVQRPTDAEIDAMLAEGEFASRAEALDCGACGYSTCVEHCGRDPHRILDVGDVLPASAPQVQAREGAPRGVRHDRRGDRAVEPASVRVATCPRRSLARRATATRSRS